MAGRAMMGEGQPSGVGFEMPEDGTSVDVDLLASLRAMQSETEKMQVQTGVLLQSIDHKLDDIRSLLRGDTKAL